MQYTIHGSDMQRVIAWERANIRHVLWSATFVSIPGDAASQVRWACNSDNLIVRTLDDAMRYAVNECRGYANLWFRVEDLDANRVFLRSGRVILAVIEPKITDFPLPIPLTLDAVSP